MRKIVKNTSSGQRAQQLINPIDDKKGFEGSIRVYRGGSGTDLPQFVRTSYPNDYDAEEQLSDLGFRIVRNGQ